MIIYKILPNFYYGGSMEHPDYEEGIPYGYTRTALPEDPCPDQHHIKWNGHEWEYVPDPPPQLPPEQKIVSKLEFLDRIGEDAYVALLTAAKTDVIIEAWINRFNLLTTIDLNDDNLRSKLDLFVEKGLLSREKADSALNS